MITKWVLANFKSVRNRTELELGPLTVLSGANSSGKSTWIQSMLLISQTLSSKVPSRSVVLNGSLAKLGQFNDLRSFKSKVTKVTIGWECAPGEDPERVLESLANLDRPQHSVLYRGELSELKAVSCEITFDSTGAGHIEALTQLRPRLSSCQLSCLMLSDGAEAERSTITAKRSKRRTTDKLSSLQGLSLGDVSNVRLRDSLEYDAKLDSSSTKELENGFPLKKLVGCSLNHFLPSRLTVAFDEVEADATLIASSLCNETGRFGSRPGRYLRDDDLPLPGSVVELLSKWLGERWPSLFQSQVDDQGPQPGTPRLTLRELTRRIRLFPMARREEVRNTLVNHFEEIREAAKGGKMSRYRLASNRLPSDISEAATYLDRLFSARLKYLGPLRDEPKALYPLSASVDPEDVGLRGEHTAAVLDLYKNHFVKYIPSENFLSRSIHQEPEERMLGDAVLDWAAYMGVADDILTLDKGKLGHELKVKTPGVDTPHDLTHVGVGVSQVLPILVCCLLADFDTTIVLEQPELHLHPRVQTLLGDFFLSMALVGKQCIVETHSEYMINRLRFRAAAAEGESLASVVKMYFAEKDKQSGTSRFRPVVINRYGAILDWPEEFFDQSVKEAEEIILAATAKRKAEREAAVDA